MLQKYIGRVQRISIWLVWIRFPAVFLASMAVSGCGHTMALGSGQRWLEAALGASELSGAGPA
jgi:hypothetical protein